MWYGPAKRFAALSGEVNAPLIQYAPRSDRKRALMARTRPSLVTAASTCASSPRACDEWMFSLRSSTHFTGRCSRFARRMAETSSG